jgi:hypothetical protein
MVQRQPPVLSWQVMTRRARLALLALALAAAGIFAAAGYVPARAQTRLEVLVARMETQDPSLESYRAAIDFTVGMHTFPFIRKSVRGTAYYKRPDRLELVMEKLPSYARGLEHIFVGLGPPETWGEKFDVTVADAGTKDEHIRLVPKDRTARVRYVAIYVDSESGLPAKLVWDYSNGHIEMTQKIEKVGGHYVGTAQDADMHYPMVHAYMHTKVHDFNWNVPVDDAVFTPSVMLNP